MNALIDGLKALRLHGMAGCAHDLLASRTPPNLTTALKQLIEAETVERRVRSIEYQMRVARFPHHKDFATFDYGISAVKKPEVEQLCTGQFTTDAHNLILVGGTGTGKTHVALGLGLAACQKGLPVAFVTAAALVNELMEARDEKRLLRRQRQLAKVKLLIIDELGFVPLSKTGAELLFELISQRYEQGSTLITSNLPFEEWTDTFGTERLTGALLDRLTHHVSILEMNGESYRLNQSRARLAKANK